MSETPEEPTPDPEVVSVLAESLAKTHAKEGNWAAVVEDYRWLGESMERDDTQREDGILAARRDVHRETGLSTADGPFEQESLTGVVTPMPVHDSMEEWVRRQTPSNIWTGAMVLDSAVEFDVLVTHWPDGSATIAYRQPGDRTWGPPNPLVSRPVE